MPQQFGHLGSERLLPVDDFQQFEKCNAVVCFGQKRPTHIFLKFEFISTGSPKILFRQQEKDVWVSERLKQIDLGIWGVQKTLTCHHGE